MILTNKNLSNNQRRKKQKFLKKKYKAIITKRINQTDFFHQILINNFIMSIQAINILDKKGNVIINKGFGEKKFEGLVD